MAQSVYRIDGWQSYEDLQGTGAITPTQPILEIEFSFNSAFIPEFTVESIERKNGYVPRLAPESPGHSVQILSADKNILFDQPFEITQDRVTFIVTMPWFSEAVYFAVLDPDGNTILSRPLARIPLEENNADFFARPDFQPEKIRLTFIGDGYNSDENAQYHAIVAQVSEYLGSGFSISYIDGPLNERIPESVANSFAAPYDHVVVINKGTLPDVLADQIIRRYVASFE